MPSTVSQFAVGLAASVEEYVTPLNSAIQTNNSFVASTAPMAAATAEIGVGTTQAVRGLGQLEALVELLGTRVLATSTSVSALTQATQRMLSQNNRLATSSQRVAAEFAREEAAAAGLGSVRKSLLTQFQQETRLGSISLVDEDADLAKINKIKAAMIQLRKEASVNQIVDQASGIDRRIAGLQGDKAGVQSERELIDIEQKIIRLQGERTVLQKKLNGLSDGETQTSRELLILEQQLKSAEQQRTQNQQNIVKEREAMALKEQIGLRSQIRRQIEDARGATDKEYAARLRVTRSAKVFNDQLKQAVATGAILPTQAAKLRNEYVRLAGVQAKSNAQLSRQTAGSGRLAFAVQNAGFAVEDFTSQLGTRGLAGAFGAASNNLSIIAATMGSLRVALFTSLTLSAIQFALQTKALNPLLESLGLSMESTSTRSKRLSKEYTDTAKAAKALLQVQRELDGVQKLTSFDSAESSLEKARQKFEDLGVEAKLANSELEKSALLTQLDQANSKLTFQAPADKVLDFLGVPDFGGLNKRVTALKEERQKILAALNDGDAGLTPAEKERQDRIDAEFAVRKQIKAQEELIEAIEKRRRELGIERLRTLAKERDAVRQQFGRLKAEAASGFEGNFLGIDLGRFTTELKKAQRDLQTAVNTTAANDIPGQERILELMKGIVAIEQKRNTLVREGFEARKEALGTLNGIRSRVNKDVGEDLRRKEEAEGFAAAVEKAQQAGLLNKQQAVEQNAILAQAQGLEQKKNDLLERQKKIRERLKALSTERSASNIVEAGSVEAARIVADAQLAGDQRKSQQPLIDELQKNEAAVKMVEQAIKNIPILNLQAAGGQ